MTSPSPCRRPPHRWRPALLAGAAALALHLLVLGGDAAWSAPAPFLPAPGKVMMTRLVPAPAAVDSSPVSAVAAAEAEAASPRLQSPPARVVRVSRAGQAAARQVGQPLGADVPGTPPAPAWAAEGDSREPSAEAADESPLPLRLAAAAAERPPAGQAETGDEPTAVPVYPTRIPPPMRLAYRLQRGMISASAVLDWQHEAGAYELKLEARAGPLNILSQHSQGRFDAAGLAPVRFTDQRLRGGPKAANFQRQRGLVSFSGPSVEYPLVPGVQDRLSWMLQLPAIVSAAPPRFVANETIVLQVIGARGDLAVWTFRPLGKEPVSTDAGVVQALKFLREPRKPNDTQVEVWLDPATGYLPVRARIGNPPDSEVFELLRTSR